MIPLYTRGAAHQVNHDIVGKVSLVAVHEHERKDIVRVFTDAQTHEPLTGYLAAISSQPLACSNIPVIDECSVKHLATGDVVVMTPQGIVQTLYRRWSSSNTLFATDRCNSLC